jgi:predicted acyl esterase
LLTPGEAFETTVMLDQIAYRIPAGHRLRIAVSTSYWPFIWPVAERTPTVSLDARSWLCLAVPCWPMGTNAALKACWRRTLAA